MMSKQPIQILVVEDEPAHAEAVRRSLQGTQSPVEVRVAGSLGEFRAAVEAQTPDLVLLDLLLPDGRAESALVSPPETAPFPMVVMTSHGDEQVAVSAIRQGALDYIVKSPEAFTNMPRTVERTLQAWRSLQERRWAQEALAASEAALQEGLLFRREAERIARIGAWKVSPQTDYLYWTEGVYEIVEAPPDYRPGLAEGLLLYDDDAQPRLRAALLEAQVNGTPFTVEAGLTTMRGRHVWTEVRGLGRVEQDGQAFVMGTFQDITERKCLEEQLRQAQKIEAVGQLAGGVAHDFNNILSSIMMQLGFLETVSGLGEEASEVVSDLHRETDRAASLTRQLLLFSRRSVVEAVPLDLNELVRNLLKMLGRLIGENIRLVFDVQPGRLPSVSADAGMLEQVVTNLVVNARDAMPGGGRVTLATSVVHFSAADLVRHPERRTGRFVCLAVADTGVGMSEETARRIFEPFFTTKEPGKGTGLGLASVHGIVAQHGGWVEVQSTLGMGATFRVFLPALADEPPADVSQKPVKAPLPRGDETILLVEDEASVRQSVGQTLASLGYRVYEAENGRTALSQWAAHGGEVDLLLTDMVMPEGLTGLELADRLREQRPSLKVIVSSGYSSEIVQSGGVARAGAVYMAKPYHRRALAEAVRACLDAGRPAQPA